MVRRQRDVARWGTWSQRGKALWWCSEIFIGFVFVIFFFQGSPGFGIPGQPGLKGDPGDRVSGATHKV